MKLGIVGQGYVGLPLSVAFSYSGLDVVGFDIDLKKVEQIICGHSPVEDVENSKLQAVAKSGKYTATNDPQNLADCDAVIIAVPTPLNESRSPDTTMLEEASKLIAQHLHSSALIVNESTSFPGTLRNLIKPIVDKFSRNGVSHRFAVSPERVDPGNKLWNLRNTPRLIAGLDLDSLNQAKQIYSLISDHLVEVSSPEVAEFAKLFENSFRQVNIALVNELATITKEFDISALEVIDAANTKPYGFMKFRPGIGVGGHCIPIDPTYLSFAAEKVGVETKFIKLANEVNHNQPKTIVSRIKNELPIDIVGSKILVCGISYKEDVADYRESPALDLLKELREEGANVCWLDPVVGEWNGEITVSKIPENLDAIVIAVMHKEFKEIDFRLHAKYILDCVGKYSPGVHL